MNTKHDETRLARWLDDELHGEELAAMEAAADSELRAARDERRRWREWFGRHLPAAEEPPYADFFNSRIQRAIREDLEARKPVARPRFSWRGWLLPLGSCAGMVLAFQLGVRRADLGRPPEIDVTGAPKAIPVEPIVYTPEKGVKAEWFSSAGAEATVIVLNGVQAIPDAVDFSHTAYLQEGAGGESERTASLPQDEAITSHFPSL